MTKSTDLSIQVIDIGAKLRPFVFYVNSLIALADVAREFGYVKPTMTTGQEIFIEEGRHPLQVLCRNSFSFGSSVL